ncbi:low molecular weight protein arginine phosphatase [Oleiharenicola lentus]|uniref:arsenate reductase/protein-tyrosine-phosphatase family protein n=1 Tax=Oleiharenicola lentus TaxID=2508720 RepID=UPI003F6703B5
MPKPGHILILCTANICRSPMAEGLLRHALSAQAEPLKSLQVISAGVAARDGDRVSENSVIALKKTGIDISASRSRGVTQEMLDGAVVVFGMTESHRAMIQARANPVPKHLYLFREFLPSSFEHEISDPYGGPLKLYESCRDEMVEAIPGIMDFLRKNVK